MRIDHLSTRSPSSFTKLSVWLRVFDAPLVLHLTFRHHSVGIHLTNLTDVCLLYTMNTYFDPQKAQSLQHQMKIDAVDVNPWAWMFTFEIRLGVGKQPIFFFFICSMIYLMKGKPEIFNHLSPSVPEPVSPHRSPINSHKVYDLPKKNVVQPKAQPRYLNTMDHLSYIILTHRHVCESSDLFACHPFPPSPPPLYTHTHTHARIARIRKIDVLIGFFCD